MKNNNYLHTPRISTVYHWSPSENRDSILQTGLKILVPQEEYVTPVTGKIERWKPPYICTSLDPWTALCYCIPSHEDDDIESYDLYAITLREDRVEIRNDRTTEILEIRVLNTIPPDRVNYLATREV